MVPFFLFYRKDSDAIRARPSNLFVFIDENPTGINDASFLCDPDQPSFPTEWIDYPAYYHNQAGGIAFADAHAEIHRWHDPALTAVITQNANGNNTPINGKAVGANARIPRFTLPTKRQHRGQVILLEINTASSRRLSSMPHPKWGMIFKRLKPCRMNISQYRIDY